MYKELRKNPMYTYLLLLSITIVAGLQAWRTIFNNFAVDEVGISGFQIGVIQSVREIPGFMALLVVYLILIIKEHKIAALSVLVMGVGVCLTGFFPSFGGLIFTTLIMSLGFHYFETINKSLTLQYFTKKQVPIVLGRIKSFGAITNIIVGGLIWVLTKYFNLSDIFLLFGLLIILSGLYALTRNPVDKSIPAQSKRMVLKKKYWLFYTLNFLSGARRQIFVAFAVFMLVEKFEYKVETIAILFIINNVITYFVAPLIAKAINKYGEKWVLSIEYISLIGIFIAYALVKDKTLVAVLYVLDHIFFGAAMAVNTYFHKIGNKEDIAPSMAVGFTINHISAVIIPVVGGALWMIDSRIPFFAGALIALVSLFFVQKIKIPSQN
ncbi:MFS transporter [Labilibacter marinus]|uniref:MFS transporter n=1 Tax=Labilibacter marinus TaxID=1477105 RepID=UPI00082F451B|nr:MFS transporter [Labilibacter marinus]